MTEIDLDAIVLEADDLNWPGVAHLRKKLGMEGDLNSPGKQNRSCRTDLLLRGSQPKCSRWHGNR